MSSLIITLDGPAGSGKSTVARRLAKQLGLEFLDTGAMYRGVAALCVDAGVDPSSDPDRAGNLARDAHLRFDWTTDPPHLYINDIDVTARLRDSDVTARVSPVAAIGAVREVLVRAQQCIGGEHQRLVTEGRDQGSVVFPDADVKFYLDANPQVRARRRADEIRRAGMNVDETEILQQITERDQLDSIRRDGPLICPDDARRIDTSDMTLDQVVGHLENEVRQSVGTEIELQPKGLA